MTEPCALCNLNVDVLANHVTIERQPAPDCDSVLGVLHERCATDLFVILEAARKAYRDEAKLRDS